MARGRRDKRKVDASAQPGRRRGSEDRARDTPHSVFHFERGLRKHPGPRVAETPDKALSRREVETRLMRAMKTLRALPDKERRFFVVKNSMPEYLQEYIDAYNSVEALVPRFHPTPFDVSDYLTALSWARHLSPSDWKILGWRSFDRSFGEIARYIGRSDETARRRYGDIITDVWCAANNIGSRGVA